MEPRRGWSFYDFRNDRGENEIQTWTRGPGRAAKARMNALIRNLAVLERGFTRADSVGLLRKAGPCKEEGLIELLITIKKVQYRPIGWYGPDPRTVTLLVGATERDGEFAPRNAGEQAVNRKRLVLRNRKQHLVDHDYS